MSRISRCLAQAATIALMAWGLTVPAEAAAPQIKTQVPGVYRVMLGDIEVTALSDGTVALPVDKLLTHTTAAKTDKTLARAYLKSPLDTSVNAYLINTGTKLVLVDTGAAGYFGPTLARIQESLKAAGYQPEQVDEIYITHMHADHIGGLMAGDTFAFPNAVLRIDRHEADYWLSAANAEKAPAGAEVHFKAAAATVGRYAAAGKFKPFDGATELVPGVRAMAAPGHTPGHTVYVVESQGQKLMLFGDLIHVAAVQFAEPSVTIAFDSDSRAAEAQRQRTFADAARQGYMVGGAHLPFPGLGRMRAEGKGYVFLPVNYTGSK